MALFFTAPDEFNPYVESLPASKQKKNGFKKEASVCDNL